VFPSKRLAVFIDGCFWHGCPEHYVRPRSSGSFWADKLADNVRRDVDQTRRLEALGWRVCRVWEHEVFEEPDQVVQRIRSAIRKRLWDPPDSWRVWKVAEADPSADTEDRYLQDLRDPAQRRTVTRKRTTRKWAMNLGVEPGQRTRRT
jgi:DNA mismatch endonuclease (patch repair protein)